MRTPGTHVDLRHTCGPLAHMRTSGNITTFAHINVYNTYGMERMFLLIHIVVDQYRHRSLLDIACVCMILLLFYGAP